MTVICAKTTELTKMPFGLWTRVGPRSHVLDGVQIVGPRNRVLDGDPNPLYKRGNFDGGKRGPSVKYSDLLPCAKMAELIEMPFGTCTRFGSRKHY